MNNKMLYSVIYVLVCVINIAKLSSCAYIYGYMLHNPIPDDLSLANSYQRDDNSTLTSIKCTEDTDCEESDMYCDSHYRQCDYLHDEGELCRRDGQCRQGLICIFGKCETPSKPGTKGSRCSDDSDCKSNLCCARQHGERICKSKLQRGHRCYVPLGGLDYSLNELCPCDEGLECQKVKTKHKRYVLTVCV